MPPANLIEDITGGISPATSHIFHALPDSLMHVGTSSYIEQALIRFRILHYGFRFPFNCQNNRALIFFKLFHKSPGLRRKVVTDWMSFVMSNMEGSLD